MKTSLLLWIYLTLVVLLALTIGVAFLPVEGGLKPAAGLLVAAVKAGLIAMFFMELRERGGVARLFAAAGAFWLLLLFALTAADYLTRGWH